MHEASEGVINAIVQPAVIFSHTNELKIPELADAETDPIKNLKENGATPPVGTHPSLPHPPLEYILVSLAEPPPCPCFEDGDAYLQERAEDFLDVRLLGSDYMLYGIYNDWVHQNPSEHLNV